MMKQNFVCVFCFLSLFVCLFIFPVRHLRIFNKHMFLEIISRAREGERLFRISQKFIILETNTETSVSKKTG